MAETVERSLAAALRLWFYPEEGGHLYREHAATDMANRVAAAILSLVEAVADRRAADELRWAADVVRDDHGTASLPAQQIDARAAVLRAGRP